MWSNKTSGSSNRRKTSCKRAANIKGYLGGFSSVEYYNDDASESVSALSTDISSVGLASVVDFAMTETTTSAFGRTNIQSSSNGNGGSNKNDNNNERTTEPSVLVEIPEDFPQELDRSINGIENSDNNNITHDFFSCYCTESQMDDTASTTSSSVTARRKIAEMKRRWHENSNEKSDTSAVAEIEENLFDMENYMLSVYMNDDASIYTKAGHTPDTSFSSTGSTCSTASTRQRHRGAHKNRRRASHKPLEHKGNWLDSMKETSSNFFVDGQGGWSASEGWQITHKKTWESQPDDRWNDCNHIFDAVKQERLEI